MALVVLIVGSGPAAVVHGRGVLGVGNIETPDLSIVEPTGLLTFVPVIVVPTLDRRRTGPLLIVQPESFQPELEGAKVGRHSDGERSRCRDWLYTNLPRDQEVCSHPRPLKKPPKSAKVVC